MFSLRAVARDAHRTESPDTRPKSDIHGRGLFQARQRIADRLTVSLDGFHNLHRRSIVGVAGSIHSRFQGPGIKSVRIGTSQSKTL